MTRWIAISAMALLGIAACSSTGTAGSKLGDTVYVDSGGGTPTPAGVTRTDFDHISSALAASDKVGISDLLASGAVVMVDACAPVILLDTAFGGERQVRVSASGQAVWVDVNWLKGSASECG